MGISKSTFYRYISDLLKDGTVKQEKEGYSIITDLFPVCYSKKKIEEFRASLEEVRGSYKPTKEFEQSPFYPMYKQFYYYYNKGFEGLKMSPEEFVMNLSAGLFGKKKRGKDQSEKTLPEYGVYAINGAVH